jgi:hypothetical protein
LENSDLLRSTTLADFHIYHADRNAYRVLAVRENQKEIGHYEDLNLGGRIM